MSLSGEGDTKNTKTAAFAAMMPRILHGSDRNRVRHALHLREDDRSARVLHARWAGLGLNARLIGDWCHHSRTAARIVRRRTRHGCTGRHNGPRGNGLRIAAGRGHRHGGGNDSTRRERCLHCTGGGIGNRLSRELLLRHSRLRVDRRRVRRRIGIGLPMVGTANKKTRQQAAENRRINAKHGTLHRFHSCKSPPENGTVKLAGW